MGVIRLDEVIKLDSQWHMWLSTQEGLSQAVQGTLAFREYRDTFRLLTRQITENIVSEIAKMSNVF